jgi:hypothetical protein
MRKSGAIEYSLDYRPQGPMLAQFHDTLDNHHRFIMGPLGSAKTTTVVVDVFDLMCMMPKDINGIRRSRWAAVRNTYPDLKRTTIPEWLDVVPEELGAYNGQDLVHKMDFIDEDTGDHVMAEMHFIALDRPDDVKKLRGMQLTGGWLNEAKELPFAVVQMLFGRCGRYPRRSEVQDPFWWGVVGDTNAPDVDSWYHRLAEVDRPEGWVFIRQPGGVTRENEKWVLNPEAENLQNLPPNYYQYQIDGNNDDWIKVNLANDYGFVMDGKPMYPEYQDYIHCSKEVIPFNPQFPIVLGADFGRTPACAFLQHINHQWRVIDEVVTDDMGAVRYVELVQAKLNGPFAGAKVVGWGDPSGGYGQQLDERVVFDIFLDAGIPMDPAPSQDPTVRRESVAKHLTKLTIMGTPSLLISPNCHYLRKGLAGGYHLKRMAVLGEERFHEKPNKNIYSHICESLEYALVGEGEGYRLIESPASVARGTFKPKVKRAVG